VVFGPNDSYLLQSILTIFVISYFLALLRGVTDELRSDIIDNQDQRYSMIVSD